MQRHRNGSTKQAGPKATAKHDTLLRNAHLQRAATVFESNSSGMTWPSMSHCTKRKNFLIYRLPDPQSINGCDSLTRQVNCRPTIYIQQVFQPCYLNCLQKSGRHLNLISNPIYFKEPQLFSSSGSLLTKIFFFLYRKTHSALMRVAQPIQLSRYTWTNMKPAGNC